ncbi:UNVERIFIED_ORG: hypothetical protein ABIC62_005687 [Burkholderia sp. 1595]|uniref:Uncharacterized protein n=1 Tax=Paraburkholderia terricola TaxID=169427 RepID=A0ABU1LZQ3_9BURK|nr:hypothetical protein [Paraburkholderia terricola]MDR6412237.1 hypothetical protein [Paraburkholderia terricola]
MPDWTNAPPAVEGCFWMKRRYGGKPELVRVVHDAGLGRWEVQTFGESMPAFLRHFAGALWFGPLEPPALPQGETE